MRGLYYQLFCSCGRAKHETTRVDMILWYLEHRKLEGDHKVEIVWHYQGRERILREDEIQDFIEYIESGKYQANQEAHPWGLPGLGHGKPEGLC